MIMLGTGNATVTQCYNTCFVLQENDRYFLVDGGGGNGLLHQLEAAHLNWQDMRTLFVTHKHVDHLLGILWMVRMICQNMSRGNYEGEAVIYGHEEGIRLIRSMSEMLFAKKEVQYLDERLHLIPVADGEEKEILGRKVTFFDIQSTKAKQFGFMLGLHSGKKLSCLGDEPCTPRGRKYAAGSGWLLSEAFCLYADRDRFKPYEKHHSTALDAGKTAATLHARNLIIYHTEDDSLPSRQKAYAAEAALNFSGHIVVPDDLDTIAL